MVGRVDAELGWEGIGKGRMGKGGFGLERGGGMETLLHRRRYPPARRGREHILERIHAIGEGFLRWETGRGGRGGDFRV